MIFASMRSPVRARLAPSQERPAIRDLSGRRDWMLKAASTLHFLAAAIDQPLERCRLITWA
jgi:hypothetical protein